MGEKVAKSTIVISILCLFVIMTSPYLGQRINNVIKLAFEIILLIVLLSYKINLKIIGNCIPIYVYFIITNISTYLNHGFGSRLVNSIVTNLSYTLFFVFFSKYVYEFGFHKILKIVRKNFIIYSAIMDLIILLTMGKGLGGRLMEPVFLLGNKFMVSYLHMFVLATMFYNNSDQISTRKKRICAITYLLYSIILLKFIDTTTGLVGIIVVALLLFLMERGEFLFKLIKSPISIIIIFLGSNAILLLTDFIFSNSFVHNLLLNYSHTTTLLSGRYQMYQIVMNAIVKRPLWGYGLNSEIVLDTLSYGNAQNGLLKSLLDFGVLGTVSFLVLIYMSFKNSLVEKCTAKYYCVVYIIGMLACSLVEINLATMFFLVLAILYGAGVRKERKVLTKLCFRIKKKNRHRNKVGEEYGLKTNNW